MDARLHVQCPPGGLRRGGGEPGDHRCASTGAVDDGLPGRGRRLLHPDLGCLPAHRGLLHLAEHLGALGRERGPGRATADDALSGGGYVTGWDRGHGQHGGRRGE